MEFRDLVMDFCVMAGVAELIGRGVVAVIAGEMRSYTGVCLAGPAAWSLAAALLIVMYFFIMNVHLKKVFGTNGKTDEVFPFLYTNVVIKTISQRK